MAKLIVQTSGDIYVVGMQGTAEEIKYQYYSFLNIGITKGELYFLKENFAYIYVPENEFFEWLKKSSIRMFENEIDDDYIASNETHCQRVQEIYNKRRRDIFYHTFLEERTKREFDIFNVIGLNNETYAI